MSDPYVEWLSQRERAERERDAARAEVERLEAAVQAVRDLHKPTPGSLGMGSPYTYCDVEGVSAPWPCLTVEALDAALEQENNR